MPLYEYECPKHGTFERMQKFSDPPVTACPVCGGPVEKLLSAPAIQFKGTGWYVTDYAKKSGSPSSPETSKVDGGATKPAESKSESGSDSKSAAVTPSSEHRFSRDAISAGESVGNRLIATTAGWRRSRGLVVARRSAIGWSC